MKKTIGLLIIVVIPLALFYNNWKYGQQIKKISWPLRTEAVLTCLAEQAQKLDTIISFDELLLAALSKDDCYFSFAKTLKEGDFIFENHGTVIKVYGRQPDFFNNFLGKGDEINGNFTLYLDDTLDMPGDFFALGVARNELDTAFEIGFRKAMFLQAQKYEREHPSYYAYHNSKMLIFYLNNDRKTYSYQYKGSSDNYEVERFATSALPFVDSILSANKIIVLQNWMSVPSFSAPPPPYLK